MARGRRPALGEEVAARVLDAAGLGAHQAHRPIQRQLGDLFPRAGGEQGLGRGAEGLLFACPPLAAQPGRRREADVEQRHDGQRQKLEDGFQEGGAGGAAGSGADDHQQEQPGEAGAQRAQAGALDGRPVAGGEPEPQAGLRHQQCPDQECS